MTSGITSTVVAQLLRVREDALRKRISRGRFPASKLDGTWDRETIADSRHLLPAGVFVPPHWNRPGSVPTQFLGMHSVPTSGGHAVALVALIDGRRVGLVYEDPSLLGGPTHDFLSTQLGLDYAYEVSSQITGTGNPSLSGADLTDCSISEPHGGFVDDMWPRLSRLLGFPLPWWPSRLREPSAMLGWRPGTSAVAIPMRSDLPGHSEMAARAVLAATGSPVIERYLRYYEEIEDHSGDLPASSVLTHAAVAEAPASPRVERPDDAAIARIAVPADMSLAGPARTLLFANEQVGCSFAIPADTDDRFERALLDMPTVGDEEFDRSLLALAVRRDEDMVFRRIEGSDARIGRGSGNDVVVVPPTTIPGLGTPKIFELPGLHHPIVVDTEKKAWPFPVTQGLTAYQVGYRGAGPTGYAFAIAQMLSDPSQPVSLGTREVVIPDGGGKPLVVTARAAHRAFCDDIVGAGIRAENALARLRKAAQEADAEA